MLELKWAVKTPNSRVQKNLRSLAEAHRAELFSEWEKKVRER